MIKKLKNILVGKPLNNNEIHGQKFSVFWGLPILASDAISSIAYAGQEMLIILIPVIGLLAYQQMFILSCVIIALLFILMLSYRQTIESYPNGGGSYIVAKDNLGTLAGITAGAALSVDYILTVAVSVSSGVENFVSAFPSLKNHNVIICVVLVLILMIGNLRGIHESSRIFGVPTYAFIFAVSSMIIWGFFKAVTGSYQVQELELPDMPKQSLLFMIVLMLKAFSSGCTALTGVEAVSNSVPNFKDPPRKHAKSVLLLLSFIILILFGGTSILANIFHVIPGERAFLILMAEQIFGNGFMYYFLTITTFTILILAANTAYSGFPILISVVSRDGYAPRQLSKRGDRLVFDKGMIILSAIAILLIVFLHARVSALIGLYAVGVFISFTLSQFGMFIKWKRLKTKGWKFKAFINGLGAIVTSIAVVIIAVSKFHEGAWIVVVVIPILIFAMLKVKRHYESVKEQLKFYEQDYDDFNNNRKVYINHVIVPIESVNKSSVRAIKYAKTIVDAEITVFTVVVDEESKKDIEDKYKKLNIDIPLTVVYSPYRKIVEPLLEFIDSSNFGYKKGDIVTVILSQFNVSNWWSQILHNHTTFFIEKKLLKHKHIAVSKVPFQLKEDNKNILKSK